MRTIIAAIALFAVALLISTPYTFRIFIHLTSHNTHLAWVIGGYVSDTAKALAMVLLAGGYAEMLVKPAEAHRSRLP